MLPATDDPLMGQTAPDQLFHYTTYGGLRGIIESRSLWLSDARFLNDRNEIRHFHQRLRAAIDRRLLASVAGSDEHQILVEFLRWRESFSDTDDWPHSPIYVASFCTDPDLISQWQGYAAGGGVAIGFDTKQLRSWAFRHKDDAGRRAYLGRCIYDDAEKDSVLDTFLFDILKSALPLLSNAGPMASIPLYQTLDFQGRLDELYYISALFKDKSFKAESEWRIVITTRGHRTFGTAHRDGRMGPIPYRRMSIAEYPTQGIKELLTTITIGPAVDAALTRMSCASLLLANLEHQIYASRLLDDKMLTRSSAPLRQFG